MLLPENVKTIVSKWRLNNKIKYCYLFHQKLDQKLIHIHFIRNKYPEKVSCFYQKKLLAQKMDKM